MSVTSHLHESEADLEVKRTAWRGTKKRLHVWVNLFAEAHVPGESTSPKQDSVLIHADKECYPKMLIRKLGKLGKLARRISVAEDPKKKTELQLKFEEAQRGYAHSIGLGQAYE